jgi:hypothetical protein
MTPSMAELANWPVEGFCDDAVAVASSATFVSAPEPAATVIVTVDGALVSEPLDTVSENVSVAGPVGAVKVGFTMVVLDNVTAEPAV